MKRAVAISASACLILFVGCSAYDARLAKTLEEMRYRKRLDDNLMPPATKGKLEELQIFVRPPKSLKGPTQTFAWTVVEPGRFDLENSFIDESKGKASTFSFASRSPRPRQPPRRRQRRRRRLFREATSPRTSSSW